MRSIENKLKYGLSAETYFSLPCANASALKCLSNHSPAKAKAMLEEPRKPTPSMILGSAVHCKILESAEFNARYAILDLDLRKTADKETKRDAEANGMQILSREDYADILAMEKSIRDHKEARHLLYGGKSEVTALWTDKESGAKCKARFDHWQLKLNAIVDLKTCVDISDDGISKALTSYSYYLQAGHYLNGAEACTGKSNTDFIFVFLETVKPFEVRVGRLSLDVICYAQASLKPLYKLYQECVTKDNWPKREETIEEFSLSAWKMRELMHLGAM